VAKWTVACGACGFGWHRAGVVAEYERQAIESRPCPGCGLYTLACREPKPAARKGRRGTSPPGTKPGRRAA
jgi:hypothetical protein